MEDCAITKVLSKDDRVCGVETTMGSIECDYFVNCAGIDILFFNFIIK